MAKAKILQLGVLVELMDKVQASLDQKKVEEFKDDGEATVPVNAANVQAAVTALQDAKLKLEKICQQGVFGVRVK